MTGVIDFGDRRIVGPAYDLMYRYEDCGPNCLPLFPERSPYDDTERLMTKLRFSSRCDTLRYVLDGLDAPDPAQVREGLTLLQEQADGAC